MDKTRLGFLISGVLVILMPGIFAYVAEVLISPILVIYYLTAFLAVFYHPLEASLVYIIKRGVVNLFILLIIGWLITIFESAEYGSGLLGSYADIYFLINILTPLILIILVGFILRIIFLDLKN